jgi:hypothetical protein
LERKVTTTVLKRATASEMSAEDLAQKSAIYLTLTCELGNSHEAANRAVVQGANGNGGVLSVLLCLRCNAPSSTPLIVHQTMVWKANQVANLMSSDSYGAAPRSCYDLSRAVAVEIHSCDRRVHM